MPQRHLGAILASGLALAALPAAAQVVPDPFLGGRTSDLAALCAAGPADPQVTSAINHCAGCLMAVGQLHVEMTREGARIAPLFRLPSPRPSVATITTGFATWAAANPQFGATPAVEGVVRHASAAFPCPDRPTRRR